MRSLTVAGLVLLAVASAARAAAALPDVACLRALRSARIAQRQGDAALELRRLQGARESCGGAIEPLVALLDYHRRHALPEAEHAALRATLIARLLDVASPLPPGVVGHLIQEPGLEPELLEVVEQGLRSRLETSALARSTTARLLRMLADVERRLDRPEEAAETLERLLATERSRDAVWALIEIDTRLERWRDLADLLGLEIDAGAVPLRFLYVEALSRAGDVQRLMPQLEALVGELPEPAADWERSGVVEQLVRVAWNLRDAGRDAEAEQLFRRALAIDPEHAESREAVLYLYGSEKERSAHAAALSEQWRNEEDPQTLLDEASQRLASRDYASALELLRRAAPSFPDTEAAWYNLGIAAYRTESWDEAERAFAHASSLNAARTESYFFRGLALTKLERCADAIAPLEEALRLDPNRVLAHYHLAVCYAQAGDAERSRAHSQAYQAGRTP